MIWGGYRVETCVSSRGKNVSHLWLKVWRVFWRILWMVSGVHWFESTVKGRRSWIIVSLPSVLGNFWKLLADLEVPSQAAAIWERRPAKGSKH